MELVLKEQEVKYQVGSEKLELIKVAQHKAQIRKKNIESFTEKYGQKPTGRMFRLMNIEGGNFVPFDIRDIKAVTKISGPIGLYIYLRLSINWDIGYTDEGKSDTFANLDKYLFEDGFLCTLRTQRYIAEKLETSQQNVCNWFKKLEDMKVIKRIGSEKVIIGGFEEAVPVFSLGELINVNEFDEEVFYLEKGKFDKELCR